MPLFTNSCGEPLFDADIAQMNLFPPTECRWCSNRALSTFG